MPNDCLVPGTEYIPDREAANFCEEYHLPEKKLPSSTLDPNAVSKKLFGDDPSPQKKTEDPKEKFRNLFGD